MALAAPAIAEEPSTARCALLGPLVMSGYVGFVRDVAGQRAEEASAAATRLDALIALHTRLGCDGDALTVAIECLTTRLLGGATLPPAEIAQSCMTEAGLPLR